MSNFLLQINTPDSNLFDGQVNSVILNTTSGQTTYLDDHWDSVVQLEVAMIEITDDNSEIHKYAINGGVATFGDNKLTVSTIEGVEIIGRKPDLQAFPKSLDLKQAQVQSEINKALESAGFFEENKDNLSALVAEERLAKVQVLNEILRGS